MSLSAYQQNSTSLWETGRCKLYFSGAGNSSQTHSSSVYSVIATDMGISTTSAASKSFKEVVSDKTCEHAAWRKLLIYTNTYTSRYCVWLQKERKLQCPLTVTPPWSELSPHSVPAFREMSTVQSELPSFYYRIHTTFPSLAVCW